MSKPLNDVEMAMLRWLVTKAMEPKPDDRIVFGRCGCGEPLCVVTDGKERAEIVQRKKP